MNNTSNYSKRSRIVRFSPRTQAGWGLVDMMLAVIAAIVISAVLYGVYHLVTSDSRSSSENDALVSAVGLIQGHCNNGVNGYGTNGANLDTCLINLGKVPSGWKAVGTTGLVNAYGGNVTISSTGTGFTLNDAGLPSDACSDAAGANSTTFSIATTSINGGTAQTGSISNASTQCSNSGTGNAVLFTFPY